MWALDEGGKAVMTAKKDESHAAQMFGDAEVEGEAEEDTLYPEQGQDHASPTWCRTSQTPGTSF